MAVNLNSLEPVEVLALHKVDLSKKLRDQIAPGEYPVNLVVQLQGTVKVGKDYDSEVSAAVPWKDLLLAALATMDAGDRERFVTSYLRASEDGPAAVDTSAIEQEVKDLTDQIMGTTWKTCRGKTTAQLEVEALDRAVVLEEVPA